MNIPKIFVLKNNVVPQMDINKSTPRFGLKMADPLQADTVSFKASPKLANRACEVNRTTAIAVRQRMEEPAQRVFDFIETNFGDLVATVKEPKNPILKIHKRLKSVDSITEKTGTRMLNSVDDIITHMTDLVGLKFELRNSHKHDVDNILGRFIPLIKSGSLELLEIENKRPMVVKGAPEAEAAIYDYGTVSMMEKMADTQHDVWRKNKKRAKVKQNLDDDFTDVNYCATHYLFKLLGKKPAVFELQVIGHNTNLAKHVDDAVYKKLAGKEPKDVPPEFNELFRPLTDFDFFAAEPDAERIVNRAREVLNKYRGDVFLYQRSKADMPYTKKKNQEMFLPIADKMFPSDIELKYGISTSDFDYNNIAKMVTKGEKLAERTRKAEAATGKHKK